MVLPEPLSDSVAVTVLGIILATGVVWLGSRLVEDSIEELADEYDLTQSLREAIVLPAASSAPELLTVLVAAVWGAFEIGVGAILGSAIFNILVIPAFVGIASPGVIDSDQPAVYLEVLWYLVAILALTLTVVLSLLYHGPVGASGEFVAELGPSVALLLLLLYAAHYVIHRADVEESETAIADGGTPERSWAPWARLAAGAVVLIGGIYVLVWAVDKLSSASNVSGFLMGATYLAAATSVPDLLVLLRERAAGSETAGLTHVVGSNTFDLLVGIPAGVLLVAAVPVVGAATVPVGALVPLVAVLTVATLLLFAFLRTNLELTTAESYVLLTAYMIFIVLAVAEMVGITALLTGV